jgi:hypothetical protein
MRRSSTSRPVLPADWLEVLGRVQQTLEQAETAAAQRAAALETPSATVEPDTDSAPGWRRGLSEACTRVDGLGVCANQAAQAVAEVDAALGMGEESLRHWLTANEAARRRLAEWVGRAVG